MKALTIKDSEKFLRQISTVVDFNDPDLKQNISDLKEYTFNNKVYAMASIQLGIPKRIVFIKQLEKHKEGIEPNLCEILMINPIIISKKGRTEFWESCRSGAGNIGLVERPYEVVVKFLDEQGFEHVERFEGFPSTIISHELDHLDGIFHMDRAKKLVSPDQEDYDERRNLIINNNPYIIHSKTCIFDYDNK